MLCNLIFRIFLEFFTEVGFYLICFLELYTFLEDKFATLNSSILQLADIFELRIQRLESTLNGQFIRQKEIAEHATHRFNRLIGTLGDSCGQLKELQDKLEIVLQGILANTQRGLFNSQEVVSQVSKTQLSFAHLVDDMEGMKNLAHIDQEMAALKSELRSFHSHGSIPSSSSASQLVSADLSSFQANMYDNHQRMEELLHTRLATMQTQLRTNLSAMETRMKSIDVWLSKCAQFLERVCSRICVYVVELKGVGVIVLQCELYSNFE
ncbi:hypothetical protein Taro_032901 [Colocasia esculenta]|uniref:Uncharacterized protein n=1 Tax=Colocasia esculenta TaxID=4460 RepID=A0A843WAU6_COLES|nr:hypothetical protein [Colocasia esculenta]